MSVRIDKSTVFYEEASAYAGVKKAVKLVKKDMELVFGSYPNVYCKEENKKDFSVIIYGTVGKSEILEQLDKAGKIDLKAIQGKWEVYLFSILENPLEGIEKAIVIAGSDKRGTIYGLFHLSELLGVSPLVNWNHVWPKQKTSVEFSSRDSLISKVPSVKYRGFFINDEWPAFGTWAKTHFGGMNTKCYEKIFELLLRLKGNYLWPAMWDSNFNLDGPGLENARLADEYGIVMSTSHHEPCMRSGQEYSMVRGVDSVYGDAWDFRKNPEGITRFWRDGLLRNREFENVITMGMRGENDTPLLDGISLKENVELLRKIIKTQNDLIKETVNPNLDEVPRQIVLFTEVEEFFYGNEDVPGLLGEPELDGVTLMLSDNNAGATRTLPSEAMRNHRGGYGMYYHLDMHGGPHSFQWIGSAYLPKIWEQMTMAYEYGVREIWVVNVGDVATQEYGLSYFLDLAYDMETYGKAGCKGTVEYTKRWIDRQFMSIYSEKDREMLKQIFMEYTGLLAKRKHELMNESVYHPVHFGEADEIFECSEWILNACNELKAKCPKEILPAFISLVYYPACGTANLMKMWILAGKNKLYAKQNRVEANRIADEIAECFRIDTALTEEYHQIGDGMFDGFGLSEHIGFTNWNEEDNKYPTRRYIYPANHPRMILCRKTDEDYVIGSPWVDALLTRIDNPQIWNDALRPDVKEIVFEIACASRVSITYQIECDCPWMTFSKMQGVTKETETIVLTIQREKLKGRVSGTFKVKNVGFGESTITIEAENLPEQVEHNVFLERNHYISMEAVHFAKKEDTKKGGFEILEPYGRTGSAIKAFPVTTDFLKEQEKPWVEYFFEASETGTYKIRFYMSATTPVVYERKQYIGFAVNEEALQIVNTIYHEEEQFFLSEQWKQEANDNIKLLECRVTCRKGKNRLRFFAVSPAIVLEKIVLYPEGIPLLDSYLGPKESYRT